MLQHRKQAAAAEGRGAAVSSGGGNLHVRVRGNHCRNPEQAMPRQMGVRPLRCMHHQPADSERSCGRARRACRRRRHHPLARRWLAPAHPLRLENLWRWGRLMPFLQGQAGEAAHSSECGSRGDALLQSD